MISWLGFRKVNCWKETHSSLVFWALSHRTAQSFCLIGFMCDPWAFESFSPQMILGRQTMIPVQSSSEAEISMGGAYQVLILTSIWSWRTMTKGITDTSHLLPPPCLVATYQPPDTAQKNQKDVWHGSRKAAGIQLMVAWNVQSGLMAGIICSSFILHRCTSKTSIKCEAQWVICKDVSSYQRCCGR